ncbi:MAG: YicC family protein [Bryobacterales bacterium]|nr:YicC family protein [Bryobacterales bacterium]
MTTTPIPTRSMTGFARLNAHILGRDCVLTVKSVNHKALDLQLNLPSAAEALENEVRKRLRTWITRGYVQLSVQMGRNGGNGNLQLNEPLFQAWLAAWRRATDLANTGASPVIEGALRVPGMLTEEEASDPAEFAAQLLVALDRLLAEHRAFREREGKAILEDLLQRAAIVADAASVAGELRGEASQYFHNRLRQRLSDLLNGHALDPQRVAQEVAILTDKTDISEEITRLQVHIHELRQLLDQGGEIGKKLDFLLQEMNREANTLLAKTANTGDFGLRITKAGLTMKAEIEKMREQALNLE